MTKKFFNVFIIATIGRPSLKESIESILDQDKHSNHKIIVVFDNCKIQKMVDDERVIYIRTQENVWGGGARNVGIEYIKEQKIDTLYISFLDDDDYITPHYGKVLYKHRKWDLVVHSIHFPWHPPARKILPPTKGKGIKRGQIGVAISVKANKLLNSKVRYVDTAAADFFFAHRLLNEGLSHYKTGIVTYIAPTHGNTGKHTKRKTKKFNG